MECTETVVVGYIMECIIWYAIYSDNLAEYGKFQSMALCLENGVFIDDKALSFEYMNVSRLNLAVGCRSISPLASSSLAFFLLLTRFAGKYCCIGCSRLRLLQYSFVSANTFVKSLHS